MTPVIRDGLSLSVIPDTDVRAIAFYFSDIDHARAREPSVEVAARRAVETSSLGSGQEYDPDANLYAAACLPCHYNTGTVPLAVRPELALNSALTLPQPTNFIQPVLRGISNTEGAPGLVMPAYASSLTDSEVARLAAYLRRTRTTRPPWADLENKVSAVRRELAVSH
jgi:cytochrome c553